MMRVWQSVVRSLERHGRCALVTLVETKGSVPREAGARLLVIPGNGFLGTIGGGTLEWQALAHAQSDLEDRTRSGGSFRLRDYALGPALGQCCGGQATLAFEIFGSEALEPARDLAAREAGGLFTTFGQQTGSGLDRRIYHGPLAPALPASALLTAERGLVEVFGDDSRTILLFGAGHVGRALMLALAPLPFRMIWADSRPDAFPPVMPEAIEAVRSGDPEALLAAAPDQAFVAVMTHSHALDLQIVDAALGAGRFGYVGLIGSATKRARFAKRLLDAGLPSSRVDQLVCPIGVPGVESKDPAAIATAVAAELLIRDSELRRQVRMPQDGARAGTRDRPGEPLVGGRR